ncbi:MAG: endonuclease III domain-containing protein [archaeon]
MKTIKLETKQIIYLYPKAPFNYTFNFYKPDHFPTSDCLFEKNILWKSFRLNGNNYGLKFEDKGTTDNPKIKLTIFSKDKLSTEIIEQITKELIYRLNLEEDLSEFNNKYKNDRYLGQIIKIRKGLRSTNLYSLYESLCVYFVLQNATVRRTVSMMENLINNYGEAIEFDSNKLSCFWQPEDMIKTTEEELRELKLGYRAKFFIKLRDEFLENKINEEKLREIKDLEQLRKEVLKIYGIGPASVEYLLFEVFHVNNGLTRIPPWEQKIMSRLIFNKDLIATKEILEFFKTRHKGYEKLAFHYLWEDLFIRHQEKSIDWLAKEIRL